MLGAVLRFFVPVVVVLLRPVMSTVGTEVKINIRQGAIVGFKDVTERGSYFDAFLGIPYAQPPVGDLRFRDPLPHPGWSGVEFVADKFGAPCPQYDSASGTVFGDENCLSLNVYTPMIANQYTGEALPVMFFVHGGAFLQGGSYLYGPAKLLGEPIVLVTINYRLGVLGFLCTEDEFGPGNYGMMDLVLGLRWVHENIKFFNGDARRVMIFGESAGAAAVSLLTLSPLTRGLFWLAITQSGSALCDWAVEEEPYSYALSVASSLHCETHSTDSIVQCLRHRPIEDIVRTQKSHLKFSFFPLRAAPVVDGAYRATPFLPYTPQVIMENKNYSQVPLITGVVTHEGILFALHILLKYAAEIRSDPYYFEDVILPQTVKLTSDNLYTPEKMAQIKNFYFKSVDLRNMEKVLPPFIDLISDILFMSCNDRTIKLHSKHAPVYSYVLSHRGNQSYSQNLIKQAYSLNIRSTVLETGVSHADDLLYLFNLPNMETMDKWHSDYYVQNTMISFWTTFAFQGSPNRLNVDPNQPVLFWNNAEESAMFYLNINAYSITRQHFRHFELSVFEYINFSPLYPPIQPIVTDTQQPYYVATWVLLALVGLLIIAAIVLAVLLTKAQRKRSYSTGSKNQLDAIDD